LLGRPRGRAGMALMHRRPSSRQRPRPALLDAADYTPEFDWQTVGKTSPVTVFRPCRQPSRWPRGRSSHRDPRYRRATTLWCR